MENIHSEKENSYFDYIMKIIWIVSWTIFCLNIFLDYSNIFSDYSNIVLFIAILSMHINFAYKPLRSLLNKDKTPNFLTNLINAIRIILSVAIIISFYRILLTKNYSLKYSYFVIGISFITNLIMSFIEDIIKRYKSRKSEGKKIDETFIFGYLILGMIVFTILYYSITGILNFEQKEIILDDLKIPDYIDIYEYNKDIDEMYSDKIEVNNTILIKEIFDQLNNEEINSLRLTDYYNYKRMVNDNKPYYMLYCRYDDKTNNKDKILENGYIYRFELTSKGYLVIREFNSESNKIFFIPDYDVYRVKLSQETINKILNYIDINK